MPYLTTFDIETILKYLLVDKYAYCNSKKKLEDIFSSNILVSFLNESIEKDIFLGNWYCPDLYVRTLDHLYKEKMITQKKWDINRIKMFFDNHLQLLLNLIIKKHIKFTDILNIYPDNVISDKLMSHIKLIFEDNSQMFRPNKIKMTISLLDIMVVYNIPINFSTISDKVIITILSSYFISKNNDNDVFLFLINMLKNYCDNKVFIHNDISYWFQKFFKSNVFYENYEKMNKNTIIQFGKYIIKENDTTPNYIREYDDFIGFVLEKQKYTQPEFMSKFITLMVIIQNIIVSTMDYYDINYKEFLAFTTSEDLEKLHFKTLISLDLVDDPAKYVPKIYTAFLGASLRDGISVSTLKKKFSEYHQVNQEIPVTLKVCLKIVLHAVQDLETVTNDQLDLLIFMLQNDLISQQELNNSIIQSFRRYTNNDYISSKLYGLDENVINILIQIFPDALEETLSKQTSIFSDRIKKITELTSKNDLSSKLILLTNLKRINVCDEKECKICTKNDVDSYYKKCGHTICTECSEMVNCCPWCKQMSECNKLYVSN